MDALTLDWILEHSLAHESLPSHVLRDLSDLVNSCPDTRCYSALQLCIRQRRFMCEGATLLTASIDELAQAYLDFGRLAHFHGVLFAQDTQLNYKATRLVRVIRDGLWRLCLIKGLELQQRHSIFEEFTDQQLVNEYFEHPQQSIALLKNVSVSSDQLAIWSELYLRAVATASVESLGSTAVSRMADMAKS